MKMTNANYVMALAVASDIDKFGKNEYDEYLAKHRIQVQNLRENMYRTIPVHVLHKLSEEFKRSEINLSTQEIDRMFVLFPHQRVRLLEDYTEHTLKMAYDVLAQFFLGCSWPQTLGLGTLDYLFMKKIREEVNRTNGGDLNTPHSFVIQHRRDRYAETLDDETKSNQ